MNVCECLLWSGVEYCFFLKLIPDSKVHGFQPTCVALLAEKEVGPCQTLEDIGGLTRTVARTCVSWRFGGLLNLILEKQVREQEAGPYAYHLDT